MSDSKMQVVGFILKGYPRLSETFITNEILLLEQLGCRLHIFALRNPGETKVQDAVRQVRARVTYIPDYFWRFFFSFVWTNLRLCWRNPGPYSSAFRFAFQRSVKRRSSSTLKRFLQAAFLVENGLPYTGVTYFHAHFSHGPTTVAFFASWLTGRGYSFSAHAKDIYLQEKEFLTRKIRHAKFVVTCTDFNRRHLLEAAGNYANVHCSYHGIDLERFQPRKRRSVNGSLPVILSIGRFVPKKGFPTLVKALGLLKEQGWSFNCFMIGGGELQTELAQLIEAYNLQDSVELLGKKSQTELMSYYEQADMFVLPCQVEESGDRDGIPNVLVEAMAMRIPVISTPISGIPELIEDGRNGHLVPEKDAPALASTIVKLIEQPRLAQQLARAGRVKVQNDFNARQNVRRIRRLLTTAQGIYNSSPSHDPLELVSELERVS